MRKAAAPSACVLAGPDGAAELSNETGSDDTTGEDAPLRPNWHQDVAPIRPRALRWLSRRRRHRSLRARPLRQSFGPFDSYSCISIDPGFDQPVWITGAQVLVDNTAVVHHVIMMLDETGASAELAGPDGSYPCESLHEQQISWFGSHFPGAGPTLMPPAAASRFPLVRAWC